MEPQAARELPANRSNSRFQRLRYLAMHACESVTLHLRLLNALFLAYLHYLPFYLRRNRVKSHGAYKSSRAEQVAVFALHSRENVLFIRECMRVISKLREFACKFCLKSNLLVLFCNHFFKDFMCLL